MSQQPGPPSESRRLLSLDAFRGATILAMILVNNPGTWEHLYWPVAHAKWHGWTPTDLIFPFFLFIVGTSLAFSLRKYRDGAAVSPAVYRRIVRRAIVLFALGLGMGLFGKFCDWWLKGGDALHLETLRIPGVLQRIALVYLAASLIVLHASFAVQGVIAAAILAGYWAMLAWLPASTAPAERLTPQGNIVRVVDRAIIGDAHLYTQGKDEPTDPEGLLSTAPAIVTTLLGYWCGVFIERRGASWRTVALLAAAGATLAAAGLVWHESLPVNKKLWTSSFVVLTGGLAMVGLAACLAAFDVAGWRRLARPLEIVGVNAIFAFVASGLTARLLDSTHIGSLSTKAWLYNNLLADHLVDPRLASVLFAAAAVAIWWAVLWLMARCGWSVRV